MTRSNIKVSVVTVTYNSEKTVKRTMDSVLCQTGPIVEHIIVDGGSSDSTLGIVEGYRKKYESRGFELRVISEKDNGPYDAMNKGVRAATGDIVGILNSDDAYDPKALATLRLAATENNADIYMGAIRIHNGENQIITKHAKNTRYQTSRHFNHPALFATRQCYSQVGEFLMGNVHADYGWYLKALKMGKRVYIIEDVLADFYIGGWSSQKSFTNTLDRISKKYQVYKENGYSRLYYIECFAQEMAKLVLVKKK